MVLRRKLLWVQGAVGRVSKVVDSGEAVRRKGTHYYSF